MNRMRVIDRGPPDVDRFAIQEELHGEWVTVHCYPTPEEAIAVIELVRNPPKRETKVVKEWPEIK